MPSHNLFGKLTKRNRRILRYFAAVLFCMTLVSNVLPVYGMDFKYDKSKNPFTYDAENGTITATVVKSGGTSLQNIHRYLLFMADPAVFNYTKEILNSNGEYQLVYKDDSSPFNWQDCRNKGYELYIFAFNHNNPSDGEVTMRTLLSTETTANFNNDTGSSMKGNLDLLGSGKTIKDLWGKKDWVLICGPNYTNTDWNCINLYCPDCYLGTTSMIFSDLDFHAFRYSATSNVITAKCESKHECACKSKAPTISITAENMEYTGSPHPGATVSGWVDADASALEKLATPQVLYAGDDYGPSETPPTEPGEYAAGLLIGDVVAVDEFSITLPKYDVEFESNGGSAVNPIKIEHGKKITKPEDPTRSEFVFTGWYSDSACTILYDFDSVVTQSFKLYAGWKPEGEKKVEKKGAVEDLDIPEGAVEISEEEKNAIKQGKNVDIIVDIKDGNPADAPKQSIESKADSLKCEKIKFIDVSMYAQIEGNTETRLITETEKEIEITINIPNGMDYLEYFVLRHHDGATDELESVTDLKARTIKFKTNKFSDYAVGGRGKKKSPTPDPAPAPDPSPGSNNSNSSGTTVTTPTVAASPIPIIGLLTGFESPKTGDTYEVAILIGVLIMGIMITVFSAKKRKEKLQ